MRAFILGLSRSLIGLGSNPMIGKKYITIYSPRFYLPLISKIYLIIELSGFFIGPCVEAALIYLRFGEIFCIFNCIGYYGALGSLILCIVHFIYFIPPENEKFLIMRNSIKGDVNKSESESFQPSFENVDDSNDKEFYKLQKEKLDKKNNKSKLNSTMKSDIINIEVNDDESSKISNRTNNANNTLTSNINEEKGKEEDDNNFYDILEKAGNIMGQNEIADKYYNNVDNGQYPNLDISNEPILLNRENKKKKNNIKSNKLRNSYYTKLVLSNILS